MDINTLSMLSPQQLAAFLRDPQNALGQKLMDEGASSSPVYTPMQGLANALKAGVGGLLSGQAEGKYIGQAKQLSDERNNALALATGKPAETQNYSDGTTINWNAQKPNYAAAMAGLGPGNTDLQDKLLGADVSQQQQQAQFGNERSLKGIDLANALKLKEFDYQNNPEMAMNKAMADYMRGFAAQPPPALATPSPSGSVAIPPVSASDFGQPPQGGIPLPPSPAQLPSAGPTVGQVTQQQNPTVGQVTAPPSGVGFSPMGAMLAKKLGLENMQIGPNGQLMQIPGSIIKGANGDILTVDQNGNVTQGVPPNPAAKSAFENKLSEINSDLEKLNAMGGTVDEGAGFLHNKGAQLAASKDQLFGIIPGGQTMLQGTPAQTLRDNIQANVKQALPLYMQAMGITPGMERAQQAQQMLLEALGSGVDKSVQHLRNNLANLSQQAGTGNVNSALRKNYPELFSSGNGSPSAQDIVNELRRRGVVQ